MQNVARGQMLLRIAPAEDWRLIAIDLETKAVQRIVREHSAKRWEGGRLDINGKKGLP